MHQLNSWHLNIAFIYFSFFKKFFEKNLIEANLGSDYSPGTGYDAHTKQSIFGIGLQGVAQDDIDKIDVCFRNDF